MFINNKLKQYHESLDIKWNDFRSNYIWQHDVEELFTLNESGIRKIYTEYSHHNRDYVLKPHNATWMIYEDCEELLKFDCQLNMNRFIIREAFALSKMPVNQEHDSKALPKYKKLLYVEFLEFLARVSDLFFAGSEMESLELHEKIEYVLDEILPIVNYKRVKQEIIIDEFSESDEDY